MIIRCIYLQKIVYLRYSVMWHSDPIKNEKTV
nr:MAG TPA: hypothetical protein [Caudoviricetes sp.]